jgi:outer membrane protein assembly factor BamA
MSTLRSLFPAVALLLAGGSAAAAATPAPAAAAAMAGPALPDAATLEAAGARIGTITIKSLDIFDLSDPAENRALFRLANRWHRRTRESVLRAQLLFNTGDLYSLRLLQETERNLRELNFLREPSVRVSGVRDGLVDIEVLTHDVWTLQLGPSFSRSGGTNNSSLGIEDTNFLGYGKTIKLDFSSNVDRNASSIEWRDPNVLGSRWRDNLYWANTSDGRERRVDVWRPFYALDVRRSVGLSVADAERIDTRYRLGATYDSYAHRQQFTSSWFGWSGGLRHGMTRRLTVGWTLLEDDFEALPAATLLPVPQNRRLEYPWLRLDWISDHFHTTHNLDLIARTEDQQFGFSGSVLLGMATTSFGADRNATIIDGAVAFGRQFRASQQLFLNGAVLSRLEQGHARDVRSSVSAAWYWRSSAHTVMHSRLYLARGSGLDLDHYYELGGDNGLRGYPLRYQMGSGVTQFKLEARVYTPWSLWRLLDIGGAAFFDAGRVHGGNPLGVPDLGWLKDVGVGLRLGNNRSSLGNVIHIDLATPLDGEKRLDKLQLLVGTEATF